MFGFLFDLTKLCGMEDIDQQRHCNSLSHALSMSESQEINAQDLFQELKIGIVILFGFK